MYALAPGRRRACVRPRVAAGPVRRRRPAPPDPGVLADGRVSSSSPIGVGEPGNLGTIIRSAEAAGADAVVVTPGTVDETNPKVVRASAGALFNVPVVAATLGEVAAAGSAPDRLLVAPRHRRTPRPTGAGASPSSPATRRPGSTTRPAIDQWVRIEHRGRAESLNVAMATTVLCFEALRQRAAAAADHGMTAVTAADGHAAAAGVAAGVARLSPWRSLPLVVAVVRAAVKDWMPGRRRRLLHGALGRRAHGAPSAARRLVVGFLRRRHSGQQPRAAAARRPRPVHQGVARTSARRSARR